MNKWFCRIAGACVVLIGSMAGCEKQPQPVLAIVGSQAVMFNTEEMERERQRNNGAVLLPPSEKVADAIYRLEGGARTRYPYGIRSMETYRNEKLARHICIRSIENSQIRWIHAGRPGDWLDFFAARYCPADKDYSKKLRRILKWA